MYLYMKIDAYIYIYTYVNINIHKYKDIHTYTYTYIYIYMYLYRYIYMYIYIFIFIFIYIGFNALPDVPSSLANLKMLYGEQSVTDTLFKTSPKSLVTAVVYWRPSDAVSLRAVTILENLQRAFPSFLTVITVVCIYVYEFLHV
jgi:hypothetical protein